MKEMELYCWGWLCGGGSGTGGGTRPVDGGIMGDPVGGPVIIKTD